MELIISSFMHCFSQRGKALSLSFSRKKLTTLSTADCSYLLHSPKNVQVSKTTEQPAAAWQCKCYVVMTIIVFSLIHVLHVWVYIAQELTPLMAVVAVK